MESEGRKTRILDQNEDDSLTLIIDLSDHPSSHCTAHSLKNPGLLWQATVNVGRVKSITKTICKLVFTPRE